ncbi:MAG: hypothetical protein QXQ37_00670 [Nitrososphaerota archaeon]
MKRLKDLSESGPYLFSLLIQIIVALIGIIAWSMKYIVTAYLTYHICLFVELGLFIFSSIYCLAKRYSIGVFLAFIPVLLLIIATM